MLGTVQVLAGAEALAFDGRKAQALLGLLLLHPNEVVPVQRVIDRLWGDDPPATASAGAPGLRRAWRKGSRRPRLTTIDAAASPPPPRSEVAPPPVAGGLAAGRRAGLGAGRRAVLARRPPVLVDVVDGCCRRG